MQRNDSVTTRRLPPLPLIGDFDITAFFATAERTFGRIEKRQRAYERPPRPPFSFLIGTRTISSSSSHEPKSLSSGTRPTSTGGSQLGSLSLFK